MSNLEVVSIFTEEALNVLARELDNSTSPEDFFAEVDAIARNDKYLLSLPVPIQLPKPLEPEKGAEKDAENAQVIFESIGEIDRANAADRRLWSYLALVTMREYMLKRWPVSGQDQDWKSAFVTHWIMKKLNRRALVRHGIARLWWISALTYDPNMERPLSKEESTPFAYTRWVFSYSNYIKSIFERQVGSTPTVMWAIIETLRKETTIPRRLASEKIPKEAHLQSGYRHLALLSEDKVREILEF